MPFFTGGTPRLTRLALRLQATHMTLPSMQSVTTLSLDVRSLARHGDIVSWMMRLQDMPRLVHLRLDNEKGRHFIFMHELIPDPRRPHGLEPIFHAAAARAHHRSRYIRRRWQLGTRCQSTPPSDGSRHHPISIAHAALRLAQPHCLL